MSDTPLIDQLESGPWPSFVKDLKRAAAKKPSAKDLLRQLDRSYKDKITHWKHGGIVGVLGYGSGIIGRYSDLPDEFPGVEHFHTVRVNQPSGWFYTTQALRDLCAIWDEHGSGVLNVHGSTGDMIFLGTTTDQLEPCFAQTDRQRLGPGRLRFRHADPELLRGHGPLRILLLRHHGPDLPAHPGIPVRYAPAVLPL